MSQCCVTCIMPKEFVANHIYIYIYTHIYIYIYIHAYVYIYICVCVRVPRLAIQLHQFHPVSICKIDQVHQSICQKDSGMRFHFFSSDSQVPG